jgi:LacI family transcriptional regulator
VGAEARAQELGFHTSLFELGEIEPALPVTRMPSVLHARGIAGALLMPFNMAQDLAGFDFHRLAAVQMDHSLVRPRLHTILPDHYVSMVNALERLVARGYRNIGLCLEEHRDARVKCKWSAAYHSFFRSFARDHAIPVHVEQRLSQRGFVEWFQQYRPDLVIGHVQLMVDWMADLGVRVPAEVGFFNLNITERTRACAGLDLQPQRLGAAAIETIVAMLHRQEYGIPNDPQTITLEAKWVEGPTLRAAG